MAGEEGSVSSACSIKVATEAVIKLIRRATMRAFTRDTTKGHDKGYHTPLQRFHFPVGRVSCGGFRSFSLAASRPKA